MAIDYQPPADGRDESHSTHWRGLPVLGMCIGVAVVLGVLLMGVEVRTDMGWVDARSGTYHRQTVWIFGITGPRRETSSPFAYRLARLGVTWQPDWRQIEGTSRNIYGQAISRGHGAAPPAYGLMRFPADRLSDDEVRRINQILAGADPAIADDEDEQKRAIYAIMNAAFDRP